MSSELSERQEGILRILRAEGRVDVERLSAHFSVSTQTIRRDLGELCDRGLAARTHGGARSVATVASREYRDRRAVKSAEKEAMGVLAASLIPDDCSVALNIGTTTEQVARALAGHTGLVVLSNNINIITTLIGTRAKDLILVGGSVRESDGAIVGEHAVEFISQYKVDFAVIGASALDEDGTVLDYDAREVSVARAILRNARTRILVADVSKFDLTAPVRICGLEDLHTFVTDAQPPAAFAEAARRAGVTILTAERKETMPSTL
jgi:DeoR family glycerol-3-phosphate regulon repressor